MGSGQRIADRYTLLRGIGTGRNGEVWLAHDEKEDRQVAVKPCWTDDHTAGLARLRGESRAVERFRDHRHVVDLHDVVDMTGEERTGYWLVMEYLAEGSLTLRKPMDPRRAARYGAQIANALQALHANNLVHCDVKPDNIGLAAEDHAKLIDFGAAYRIRPAETDTPVGPVAFTRCYAPTELAEAQSPVPRSDVYCLGAALQELVTGRPPCVRCPDHETVPPSDRLGPLYDVVAAMLRKEVAHRPDAAEAEAWLTAVAETGEAPPDVLRAPPGVPGRTTIEPRNTGDRPPGPPKGNGFRWLLAAGAVGAAGLLVGGVLWPWPWPWSGSGDDSDPSPYLSTSPFIGDERTIDPCVLMDEALFSGYGDTRLDSDYGYFSRCDVLVQLSEDVEVDVQAILADAVDGESAQLASMVGDTAVLEWGEPDDEECSRLVVPPGGDDVSIRIRARSYDGADGLCAMADVAARQAAEVFESADGLLPRRPVEPPEESLLWVDACRLVDEDALRRMGLGVAEADDAFGGWECSWPTRDDGWVQIDFTREAPVTAEDGELTEFSGHDAAVKEEGFGEDTCEVLLEHREIRDEDGGDLAEVLEIAVGGPGPMADLCADATELAAAAAAALPTA